MLNSLKNLKYNANILYKTYKYSPYILWKMRKIYLNTVYAKYEWKEHDVIYKISCESM